MFALSNPMHHRKHILIACRHLLRRAAVRTAALHSSRQLSTCRASTPRIALLQSSKPTLYRPFHQARILFAEEDRRPIPLDEASPADATTTGETVPVETLEKAAASEPLEREDVAEEFKEEAVEAAEAADTAADFAAEEASADFESLEAAAAATDAAEVAEEAADVAEAAEVETMQPGSTDINAPPQEVAAAAAATAQAAAQAAAVGAGAAAAPSEFREPAQPFSPQQDRMDTRRSSSDVRSNAAPSPILYVGNLFFEVTAPQLETEFAKFGNIINSRIVTDSRGLSKGFGYLEFERQESADRAVRESDQRVFQGRRMAVQYHVRREPRRFGNNAGGAGAARTPNEPSKTLFIGNMSYQMSDRDLNELFRDVRDVLDVRVAIDRRSGQPRGFAHADFVDIAAAERAKEMLEKKVVYGRQLRIDFSGSSRETRTI